MGPKKIITGLSWATGTPELRIREPGESSTLVDLRGVSLNYSVEPMSERRCLGHKPFRDSSTPWIDCDNRPLHDGRKCDRCAAADATFASQLHHAHTRARGELDQAVLAHLDQPNVLYLATFRGGSIKVGTSTAQRLQQRLDEQGAWRARIVVAASDGFAVRTLEDRVRAEFGLPQLVSMRRKLDGLVTPSPIARIDREIDTWTASVQALLREINDDRLSATSNDWRFSMADDSLFSHLHPYPLKLSTGNHHIELLGASGRAVVLRRPAADDRFVADLRQLYGIVLPLGEHEPDELAVQDSLF